MINTFEYVIGIDEVGRGALSGPVYLGGVMLPNVYPLYTYWFDNAAGFEAFADLKIIRDSKKLTSKNRQLVHDLILTKNLSQVVLSASNDLIDKYGIGVCLSHMTALIISILQNQSNTVVYIDGKIKLLELFNDGLIRDLISENRISQNITPTITLINQQNSSIFDNNIYIIRENKADDKYLSIAMASNLAKVKRDKFMCQIGEVHPEFDWQTNKGYGTEKHRRAISLNPKNQYLRQTFLSRIINEN